MSEDDEVLFNHVRLALDAAYHMLLYACLPSCPPWIFCRLLHSSTDVQQATLRHIQDVWELVLLLEKSDDELSCSFVYILNFSSWVVFREVCLIFEGHGWNLCDIGLQYVRQLFDALLTSLGLENNFNDLRDNENRASRNRQRSETTLAALSIRSTSPRYAKTVDFPSVSPEDVSAVTNLHCRNSLFHPEKGPMTEKELGVDPQAITDQRGQWTSSTPDSVALSQSTLLTALLCTKKDLWSKIWMTRCFRRHMVIEDMDTGTVSLIIFSSDWLLTVLDLTKANVEKKYWVVPEASSIRDYSD